jgi:hypothetical protein
MAIRYIVRPSGIRTTPNALKEALGARRTVPVASTGYSFDPSQDFFFALPRPGQLAPGVLEGRTASYHQLYNFFAATKYSQRKQLAAGGIKVPLTKGICEAREWDEGDQCVLRPMHHMAGSGFQVVPGNHQYNPYTHYLSQLFIRTHEYRVIYVLGKRVATLIKQIPATLGQDQPWTFANGATFISLSSDPATHRLHIRGFYAAAEAFHVTQQAHILAYDVMVSRDEYAVSEVNFCPSLKVQSRIDAVVARINEARS